MNAVFIPQMEQVINQEPEDGEEGTDTTTEVSGLQTQGLTTESIEEIKQLYLAAAIIHGLGDGVVAGVLDTGRIANGLRHSFLMVLVAFLMLRVMLV